MMLYRFMKFVDCFCFCFCFCLLFVLFCDFVILFSFSIFFLVSLINFGHLTDQRMESNQHRRSDWKANRNLPTGSSSLS